MTYRAARIEAALHLHEGRTVPFDDFGRVIIWQGLRLKTSAVLALADMRIAQVGGGRIRLEPLS